MVLSILWQILDDQGRYIKRIKLVECDRLMSRWYLSDHAPVLAKVNEEALESTERRKGQPHLNVKVNEKVLKCHSQPQ